MSKEVIRKKLDQIKSLLEELATLTQKPFAEFVQGFVTVRAAERNFQLIVDLACDINTQILVEREKKIPDSYRQSFADLATEGVLSQELAKTLIDSAKIRNILVHEYDFEEDYEKFYQSVKMLIPFYRDYIATIHAFVEKV